MGCVRAAYSREEGSVFRPLHPAVVVLGPTLKPHFVSIFRKKILCRMIQSECPISARMLLLEATHPKARMCQSRKFPVFGSTWGLSVPKARSSSGHTHHREEVASSANR